jgi:WD40 repeat protein
MKVSLLTIVFVVITLTLPHYGFSDVSGQETDGIYLPISFLENNKLKSLTGHQRHVFSVAFSYDGKILATGSADKTIILWDVETGEKLKTLKGHSHYIYAVAFSPDGTILASGGRDRTIIIWNTVTGQEITRLSAHRHTVMSLAFSPDGKILASGSADQQIILWDTSTWEEIRRLRGHRHHVYSVAFSPDSKTLASGSRDKTIILWDIGSGEKINTLKGHRHIVQSVTFSPDGRILASGSRDKTIVLWDVKTGKKLYTLKGHRSIIYSVAFTPDGKFLVSGSRDKTIVLWDVKTGKKLYTLKGHKGEVMSVALSREGYLLASGSADRTAALWDMRSLYIAYYFTNKTDYESMDDFERRIRNEVYPYSFPITLDNYNADNEYFETQIRGTTVFIPVPKEIAKNIKTDNVSIEGNLTYFEAGTLELVDAYLVDNISGQRFALGRHPGGMVTGKSKDYHIRTDSEKLISASTPPDLTYEVDLKDSNGDGILEGGEMIKLIVNIENRGAGPAQGTEILLSGNRTLISCLGNKRIIGDIGPYGKKEAILKCILPTRIKPETAQLSIELNEHRGYAPTEIKAFTVALKPAETKKTQRIISQLIDVDIIPSKNEDFKRENSYALIIGISKYRDKVIPGVKYAKSDAEAVAKYIENIGGIPRQNIKLLTDERVTKSDLEAYIEDWLPRRVKKDSEVFIYYAGHGTPDPESKEAYIVPYDGHPDFKSKLYPLKRMYASLNKLPTDQIIVMLDSCFSGAGERGVTSQGARPLSISIENPVLAGGKITVLAASTGTQISSDYDRVKHGLFTYYLLKGMKGEADKNKDNTIALQELYDYVRSNVSTTASIELNRDQTPVLLPDIELIKQRQIEITRIK